MKLKEFAIINMGQSPKGETYNTVERGMPFLQGRKTFGRIYPSIDTWTTNPIKIANKSEILMSVRAPVGDMNFANQEICIGRGLCSINAKNGRNKYLYYMLLNSMNDIKQKSTGTVFDSVNRNDLENLEFNFHSEKEQYKIENILGNIDTKIELNNEINNNLLELSKQLYLNIFSNTSVFEEIKLGDLCNIKYGKGLPTTQILDSGYPVYGGNGIIGYYNSKLYDESQVLISCRGAASGKVVLSKPNSFVTNNSLILEVDRLYHHYLKEYCLLNSFFAYTTGSAQPQITIDNIKDIIIKIPDATILEDFNNKCESIETKYFLNIEQNETLEQLRDILLPKLINGEIDLDNIEI